MENKIEFISEILGALLQWIKWVIIRLYRSIIPGPIESPEVIFIDPDGRHTSLWSYPKRKNANSKIEKYKNSAWKGFVFCTIATAIVIFGKYLENLIVIIKAVVK